MWTNRERASRRVAEEAALLPRRPFVAARKDLTASALQRQTDKFLTRMDVIDTFRPQRDGSRIALARQVPSAQSTNVSRRRDAICVLAFVRHHAPHGDSTS